MDMHPDISNWILDFLLRQPLKEGTFKALLSSLSIPNDKPQLKLLLLLKKLQYDVSGAAISFDLLEIFEQLEEVLFRLGDIEILESMKRAYCAVAVKCTVESLINVGKGENRNSKFKFFETVKRIWRKRIGGMQKLVNVGLGSNELWGWKDEIESAVWEDSACDNLVKKSMVIDAVEAVNVYLREENGRLMVPFIQLMADRSKDDERLNEVMKMCSKATEFEGKSETPPCAGKETDCTNRNQEVRKKVIQSRRKRPGINHSRGVKIIDSDEETFQVQPSHNDHNLPSSAVYSRVQEELESSRRKLVKNPLLILSEAAEICECTGNVRVNQIEANILIVDRTGIVQNLMEHSSKSPTRERDESNSRPDTVCGKTGLQVSVSPSKRTSPPEKFEINMFKKRRMRKIWTPMEEDTLRAGVDQFGQGNWKLILMFYKDIFVDRTEVDLKDKWRNLTRCGDT